jgi:hypothetical protein
MDRNGIRTELIVEPGLSRDEILAMESERGVRFPPEIRDVIEFSRAFTIRRDWTSEEFPWVKPEGFTVTLCGEGWTGYPGWATPNSPGEVPRGLELVTDLCGNPWVIDVGPRGNWGRVFYVSHDPPLIAYQAPDLATFLSDVFLFCTDIQSSLFIAADSEKIQQVPLVKAASFRHRGDPVIQEFASTLEDRDLIADLREERPRIGFSWQALGGDLRRHSTELLFGLTNPSRGCLSVFRGLFGRSN